MKKFRILLASLVFITATFSLGINATTHDVIIHQGNIPKDKDTGVTPIDQPDVYFDSDEMALSLHGWDSTLASYYVEVVDYYGVTVASETVAGYGWQTVYLDPDTASGTATVTITTSRGDEYSGTFYVP